MKLQIEITIGEQIVVNDVCCLPILADWGNGKTDFIARAEIIQDVEGCVMGYRLDGDYFSTQETLLKYVLSRLTLCMRKDTHSYD